MSEQDRDRGTGSEKKREREAGEGRKSKREGESEFGNTCVMLKIGLDLIPGIGPRWTAH